MSPKPNVLFVLTSHSELGSTGKKTGWYLPELAHPYHVLSKKTNITFASPKGGESPLDPSSHEAFKSDKICTEFLAETDSAVSSSSSPSSGGEEDGKTYKTTAKLSTFSTRAADFDAIFYIGGHGPMFDLASDPTSQSLIAEFWSANKIVAAVCHAPAVLTHVRLADGSLLVHDKTVTAFSNEEEEQVGLSRVVPFLPEDGLKGAGARYVKADAAWGEKVVVDGDGGRLITGQNPASATGVGEAIAKALGV